MSESNGGWPDPAERAMADAREVMRLAAVAQCCPGATNCDGDCQGHMVDQQLAALHAAPEAVRVALARSLVAATDLSAAPAEREAAAAERRGIERIAAWIEKQRNDVPMTGREAAAAIRTLLTEENRA